MQTMYGIWQIPWWGYVLVAVLLTHITIASVTIFLHRHMAHRALELHPLISHFFRFWLWLTTGIVTREWVAVHRKHHATVESGEDPHSPQVHGINKVLLQGAELYRDESTNRSTLEDYGHHCPDDWIERVLYNKHSYSGIFLMFILNVYFFGPIGVTIWAVQMIWIPLFAAGVINGVGHWGGYRNYEPHDASTNIIPWGIVIGGEELHNNHHAFASSARFSCKWWEFDLGWHYISFLQSIGLAQVKKLAPVLLIDQKKSEIDLDTVRAVVSNRFHILSAYAKQVVSEVYKEEKSKTTNRFHKRVLRRGKKLIIRAEHRLGEKAQLRLNQLLEINPSMQTVYQFKQDLQGLWTSKLSTHDELIEKLQAWCQQAEASGIESLQRFAREMQCFTLQPALA